MLELIFIFACTLIYLCSFLYRRISVLACLIVLYTAFLVDVNFYFILGIILCLTLIRFKKSGVKEEI